MLLPSAPPRHVARRWSWSASPLVLAGIGAAVVIVVALLEPALMEEGEAKLRLAA